MSDKELKQLKTKVASIFKKYGVLNASLFGSRAIGNANKQSDYDFLVEFSPKSKIGLFKLQSFEQQLEEILGSKVDIATPKSLNKHIRSEVLNTKKEIYDIRKR